MCTGAEIAAATAAAAGTAASATPAVAGGTAAAIGGAEASAPLISAGLEAALSSATPLAAEGSGLLGESTGLSSSLLQSLGSMGPEQANILAAQNEGLGLSGLNSTLQSASPTYSQLSTGLGKGADALGQLQKAQTAMGMMQPQRQQATTQRPPSMNQPQVQPLGSLFGSSTKGKTPDAAQLMILKRMGLLGGM